MQKNNVHFITTRGINLLRPFGHNSDNEIFISIIKSVNPQICLSGKKTKQKSCCHGLPSTLDSRRQRCSELLLLDRAQVLGLYSPAIGYILVAFPRLLVLFPNLID